jgi:hypothetical protein
MTIELILMSLAFNLVRADSSVLPSTCYSHSSCPANQFCASSECTDSIGRRFPCGICKLCTECRCHSVSIDLSCPPHQCPDQPTDGVRFLQGPFYAHSVVKDVSTHACVRRLLFSGGTFFDIQAAIRTDHPASAAPANLSAVAARCPPFARIGAVLNTTFHADDATFIVNVSVSSEGCSLCVAAHPCSPPMPTRSPPPSPPPPRLNNRIISMPR